MSPAEFPSTVGRIIERSAARSPDRIALEFGDRTWTYAELDAGVGRVLPACSTSGSSTAIAFPPTD